MDGKRGEPSLPRRLAGSPLPPSSPPVSSQVTLGGCICGKSTSDRHHHLLVTSHSWNTEQHRTVRGRVATAKALRTLSPSSSYIPSALFSTTCSLTCVTAQPYPGSWHSYPLVVRSPCTTWTTLFTRNRDTYLSSSNLSILELGNRKARGVGEEGEGRKKTGDGPHGKG